MRTDSELELWQQQWQSESETAAMAGAEPTTALRQKVEQQSARLRIMVLSEILLTVLLLGAITALLVRSPGLETVTLAIAVVVFLAAAWISALITRQGIWSPLANSTAAFLSVSIRRCRASLKATLFGAGLAVCELLFSSAWVFHYLSRREPLSVASFLFSLPMLLVEGLTVVFFVCLARYRRKKRIELEYLLALEDEWNHSG